LKNRELLRIVSCTSDQNAMNRRWSETRHIKNRWFIRHIIWTFYHYCHTCLCSWYLM